MLFQLKVLDQNVCNIVSTFFERYLMSAPSRKSTSFELAPPHEVPNLNERPGRSFDQIRYIFISIVFRSVLLSVNVRHPSCQPLKWNKKHCGTPLFYRKSVFNH